MNDCVLVFDRIDDATLTASAGTATGYPLVNLQDGRFRTQWKSGGVAAGQTLKVERAVVKPVSSILIANHNLASLGLTSLTIEGSDDDFATDVTTLATISVFSGDPIYSDGFLYDKASHRLKFNKGSNLSVAPQIGMIFLGTSAVLPLILNNPKRGLKADITRDESLSGLRFRSSSYLPRQSWKIDFGALKAVNNSEIHRWLNDVGVGLHPYWMKDMDDNWHFVGNDFDTMEGGAKGNVAFDYRNIQISEERVGVTINLPGGYSV
jgi:hypothetical protein